MKVSLKEARRIERRIEKESQKLKSDNEYSTDSLINIYSELPIEELVLNATQKTEQTVINALALNKARISIRRTIQHTNETSNINRLISEREQYIRNINIWECVNNKTEQIKTTNILKKNIETKVLAEESGRNGYLSSDTISFVAISKAFELMAVGKIRLAQKQIDNCDDELAALNATTKVEIPDNIVAILRDNNII